MQALERVQIMMGEPNLQVRRTLADALRQHGFGIIRHTATFAEVKMAIERNEIDLLICDVHLDGNKVCELIRKMRHHEIGNNPFLITIALAAEPTPDVVRAVINSGSDDLLLRPVSVAKLLERIVFFTRGRKGFVVTSDYIGPDRRKATRPGTEEIPVIQVPNAVRAKVTGRDDPLSYQAAIDAAASLINQHKMERHSVQIDYLIERIVPIYLMGMADDEIIPQLQRLRDAAEDIIRRMQGTPRGHVGRLCGTLAKVVATILHEPLAPSLKDVRLLPELARAIRKAFQPQEGTEEIALDISETVGRRVAGSR